jgi:hypothetical protein
LHNFVRTLLQSTIAIVPTFPHPTIQITSAYKYFHTLYALCYKSAVVIVPTFPHFTTQITSAYKILSYFVRTLLQKSCSNCTDLSAPPVRTKYFHALYALCYKSAVAIVLSFPHSTTQITYAYKILSQIVCDPKYKNVELIRRTCCAKCGSSDVTARVASINEVSVVTVQSPSMVAEKTVRGLKRRVY